MAAAFFGQIVRVGNGGSLGQAIVLATAATWLTTQLVKSLGNKLSLRSKSVCSAKSRAYAGCRLMGGSVSAIFWRPACLGAPSSRNRFP